MNVPLKDNFFSPIVQNMCICPGYHGDMFEIAAITFSDDGVECDGDRHTGCCRAIEILIAASPAPPGHSSDDIY